MSASAVTLRSDVVAPAGRPGYPPAWWGMVVLIATEAMVFLVLIATYLFLRATTKQWPPAGTELPDLTLAIPFSLLLWGSSVPIFWVDSSIKKDRLTAVRLGLLVSALMGAGFLAYTIKDFNDLHFGWRDSAYGSIFYTIVGLHAVHVAVGLAMSAVVQVKAAQGKINAARHVTLDVFSLYWHFVDSVWLVVFPTLFLAVRWR